jgi:serine/threonine protein kinase
VSSFFPAASILFDTHRIITSLKYLCVQRKMKKETNRSFDTAPESSHLFENNNTETDPPSSYHQFQVSQGLGLGGFAVVVLFERRCAYSPQGHVEEEDLLRGAAAAFVDTTSAVLSSCSCSGSIHSCRRTWLAMKTSKKENRHRHINHELNAMSQIPSSIFLQRFHDVFESEKNVFFLFEYIPGGDLFYHLSKRLTLDSRGGFTELECEVLLAEIYLGVHHLHKHMFLHGDIKVC